MVRYPFDYDLNVYVVGDDHIETAYYTWQKQPYKRTRKRGEQTWQQTTPVKIGSDEFWMIVACIDLARLR